MPPDSQVFLFENYLSLARRYCSACEFSFPGDQRQFISHVQRLLLEIYLHGRLLPETSPSSTDFDRLLERNGKEVQDMIAPKVPFSLYWQVMEPFSVDKPTPVLGDLLDDLGDIYTDLKRAILLYDSNQDEAVLDVYWMLKFDFDHHLADHSMNAMKAIHDYMVKDGYNGW